MGKLEDDPGKYSSDWMAEEYGIKVMDPDGWRNHGVDWYEPITHAEFNKYAMESTIQVENFAKFKKLYFHEPIARGEL